MSGQYLRRLCSIAALFVAVILIYTVMLVRLQIAGQDYYTMSSAVKLTTRTVAVKAQRGEIFDRSGVPLVKNQYTYDLRLDGGSIGKTNAEKNETLLSLRELCGDAMLSPASPFLATVEDGDIFFTYNDAYFESSVYGARFDKLLRELSKTTLYPTGRSRDEISATNAAFLFFLRYGVCEDDYETMLYGTNDALFLLTFRIDMETHNFSAAEPYTVATNVDLPLLSRVREVLTRGTAVVMNASRVYCYPGIASHILGRVGKIQASKVEYYTELGYPLDATVGVDGVEAAFESYLRGVDGEMTITEDAYGNIVDQVLTKAPVAGSDVWLTLDIGYQITAEEALEDDIEYIVNKAVTSDDYKKGERLIGEDADAGALTMLDVKTGEVLAMASYPTFNLATFNEDFAELNSDPTSPMLNRALFGRYPPGSVFKVGIATAALMEGVISPSTLLECEGAYSYYSESGFTPNCWIHSAQYRYRNHGKLNVTKAIQESCNCFFFEVGRLLGIGQMNRYCTVYGFGQKTGIELGESTGVLAGPDYREQTGGESWSPGETCTAAIGQSDNLVTPLQMSVYLSTIIGSGKRLKATLLHEVHAFDGTVIYANEPTVMDEIDISSSVRTLVLNAMKDVTDYGSAARVFKGYPVAVGGKTGTAQRLETESAYATFTAFAPFDDPEVVVSCIIERGAAGTDAGFAVRDMFDDYFNLEGQE